MLDTLTDLLEQEEMAEYQIVIRNAPVVVRVFVEFDISAGKWREV